MRHRSGYKAYAKQDGLRPHEVEPCVIEDKLCCRLCSYPLAGKTYRIEVTGGFFAELLKALRAWGRPESSYLVKGELVFTADTNVVDVATETFINSRHLLTITTK